MHFTNAEVGLYARLLCVQWSTGGLPDDDAQLASYGKGRVRMTRIRSKFVKGDDGLLRNLRLESERQKQVEFRERQANNGRMGGRPTKPKPNPGLTSGLSQTEPRKSSPSPISVSTHTDNGARAREGERTLPEKLDTPTFRKAWEEWLVYWGQRNHRAMPNATADSHLRTLSSLGHSGALASLATSIDRGLSSPAEPLRDKSEPRRAERAGPMTIPQKQPGDLS